MNLALGMWFSHTRLFNLDPKKRMAFLSSSSGLKRMLTSLIVPLHSSKMAKLSWLVSAL